MPSVSPRLTLKLTPSTACTAAICFWKMIPRVIGKYFLTSFTTSRSSGLISGRSFVVVAAACSFVDT